MTGIKRIIPALIALVLLGGCSKFLKRNDELIGADFYYKRGLEMVEKKDYTRAVENFQIVVDSFPGSAIVDHAQFMLGQSHFLSEEYLTAAYEFERVYRDYPSSKWAPEGHYRKALSYYMESPDARLDQENTILAIGEFNRFIDNYPRNEFVKEAQERIEELVTKLAYKEYLAADLYRKMKNYDAAIMYYNYVLEEYPRTVWAHHSRFGIGLVHYKKKEYETARTWFQLVLNAEIDNELKEDAEKMIEAIEKRTSD